MAMGAADIVPGVSGGTVALITGIYERLLNAIVSVDQHAVRLLLTGRWSALWHKLDGVFLAALLLGILTAIFSLASGIHWLLTHYPQPLWARSADKAFGPLSKDKTRRERRKTY